MFVFENTLKMYRMNAFRFRMYGQTAKTWMYYQILSLLFGSRTAT